MNDFLLSIFLNLCVRDSWQATELSGVKESCSWILGFGPIGNPLSSPSRFMHTLSSFWSMWKWSGMSDRSGMHPHGSVLKESASPTLACEQSNSALPRYYRTSADLQGN